MVKYLTGAEKGEEGVQDSQYEVFRLGLGLNTKK